MGCVGKRTSYMTRRERIEDGRDMTQEAVTCSSDLPSYQAGAYLSSLFSSHPDEISTHRTEH